MDRPTARNQRNTFFFFFFFLESEPPPGTRMEAPIGGRIKQRCSSFLPRMMG